MKKTLLTALSIGVLTAFTNFTELPTGPEGVKELPGYKVRENLITLSDYNLWAITNDASFDKTFIPETDGVTRPKFEEELVLAAKVQTKTTSYKVRFIRAAIKNNNLNVYFTVQKNGVASDTGSPVAMVAFPKNQHVRNVNFYHDDFLVKSVPIVNVY
jgi:hypothetical protein